MLTRRRELVISRTFHKPPNKNRSWHLFCSVYELAGQPGRQVGRPLRFADHKPGGSFPRRMPGDLVSSVYEALQQDRPCTQSRDDAGHVSYFENPRHDYVLGHVTEAVFEY